MLGWAGRMVIDCADRTVPGWDLGGSLDRSWIRLLNRSRAAAEGTVADCRTRHRIAVGFGMAVGVDHVAEGSFRLEGRVDCHCIAGTGGHGNIAGTAGRWIHDTIEHGLAARCRMMTVGSLAVASDHIPAGREFHGFHIAEAARRTSVAVAVVVAFVAVGVVFVAVVVAVLLSVAVVVLVIVVVVTFIVVVVAAVVVVVVIVAVVVVHVVFPVAGGRG